MVRVLASATGKCLAKTCFVIALISFLLTSAARSGDRRPVTHKELLQLLKEREASGEEEWDALARNLVAVLYSKLKPFKRGKSAPNVL